jgi:predicted alpha/beta superfamily hydrolase
MKENFLTLVLMIYSCLSFGQAKQNNSKPFVLGVVEELDSKLLREKRTLNIYLPEGYNERDTAKYPVIYLLDGGADEDFIHVVGLVQFNSFSWINRVPRSIVVGIANTDRKRDLTFPTTVKADKVKYPTTGGAANFIAFIEKELQPYINSKYKTNSSKTLIGESLGGLLATQILFEKPTLFSKYIIISPSLWWDNGSILQQEFHISDPADIYIAVGKEGLAPSEQPHVQEVDANVLYDKLKGTKDKNVNVWFDYLPEETHATIGHQAILNAFKVLYHPVTH